MNANDSIRPTDANPPKLRLNRSTLRLLTDDDLRQVAGGSGFCRCSVMV